MNVKNLLKALKFASLPTLSVLALLFFAFFSISKTLDFISSDAALAVFIRVIIFVAEVVLIIIMYLQYEEEDKKNAILNTEFNKDENIKQIAHSIDMDHISIYTHYNRYDRVNVYKHKDHPFYIIEKTEKK